MLNFLLKVFGLSALLSVAIKYGGPLLNIPATNAGATLAVCLPSTVLAIVLGWRWQRQRS